MFRIIILIVFLYSCQEKKQDVQKYSYSSKEDSIFVLKNYTKKEYQVKMRDGVKLFTTVYSPKDKSVKYPILLKRTPYSVRPYGDKYLKRLGGSGYLMREKYIFVYQDVRGRYMSQGRYENMRPQITSKHKNRKDIDESTDTYDTIEWLINTIENNNGNVGQWGISYPGFYAAVGAVSGHPALKASSPQAPISDFYFDDFHHHGAFFLSYLLATQVFGYDKESEVTKAWYPRFWPKSDNSYEYFLKMGALKNIDKHFEKGNRFWEEIKEHPDYDEHWQKRNLLPHLRNINHAVMTVGGLFDAEDLYGPFEIYKTIEKYNPKAKNTIVMGPWSHGDWARKRGDQVIGDIYFGTGLSDFYQREIELPFFNYYLKDKGTYNLPEAYIFDTGKKEWNKFDTWPSKNVETKNLYFHPSKKLGFGEPQSNDSYSFISDPSNPVPYSKRKKFRFTPRPYMTEDQRFVSNRPDVVVFETEVLTEDITLSGELEANLFVSTDQTAADWVVKLIDVYPDNEANNEHTPKDVKLAGYQQMVRSEVIRGRYRNSYEKPEPFVPNKVSKVTLPLQDVLHTFKKGHKIMIHVQSTWFPLIDRNPQKYVKNIFKADDKDFIKAKHTVYFSKEYPSHIKVHLSK